MKTPLIILLLCCVFASVGFAQRSPILSLHPAPKAGYLISKGSSFQITASTPIVIADAADATTRTAAQFVWKELRTVAGVQPQIVLNSQFHGGPAIWIGRPNDFLLQTLAGIMPNGETLPGVQGYILDVRQNAIYIVGSDGNGVFNGSATLVQIIDSLAGHTAIPAMHIWDYPDYPDRWAFGQFNQLVPERVATLRTIEERMGRIKMNGFFDADFKNNVLDRVPSNYFPNVDSVKATASENNIELIPDVANIGYSEGILWHDPNLAEGMPSVSDYLIQGDSGILQSDNKVTLPNGGFESNTNGTFSGFTWYDGPKTNIVVDNTVYHSGSASAKITNVTGANYRVVRAMPCSRFHSYKVTVWLKTQSANGYFQILALGESTKDTLALTSTAYSYSPTQDWTKYETIFNTLDHDNVLLYTGMWGASSGTTWLDDYSVEDLGMVNVIRRAGAPLYIRNRTTGHLYTEGVDYVPISDPLLSPNPDLHTPTTIHRIPGGELMNGDQVTISYYQIIPAIQGPDATGEVNVCASEDTLYKILHDQITRVNDLYKPERFFLSFDEIRQMNWDSACLKRNESPASILAKELISCDSIVKSIHPSAQTFTWNDMFDSLHNAHDKYYLVNGDLTNDWLQIPNSVVIANWNFGARDSSLAFFEKYGFAQITCPYYDTRNTDQIRAWRISMHTIPNVQGMMYTTWAGDYSFLDAFADYAWSAGPRIVHEPLDTSVARRILNTGSATINAFVYSDPYDPTDSITSVTITLSDTTARPQKTETITLSRNGSNSYSGTIHTVPTDYYQITATNAQGLRRTTPRYRLASPADRNSVATNELTSPSITVYPNPAHSNLTVNWNGPQGSYKIEIKDELGRTMLSEHSETAKTLLSLTGLSAGSYECILISGDREYHTRFTIER